MATRIGIIGSGHVGSALQRGLARAGHDVRTSTAPTSRETADWAEVVIVAVPFGAVGDVVRQVGAALRGKVVIDVTNALGADGGLALGYTTSGAEELQAQASGARVVKCFNTVFAQHMDTGRVGDRTLTVFAAGDDADARARVLALAASIGFDAVDGGPLRNARSLEALGFFNIQLGYVLGLGTDIGFRLYHP